ncbi:Permease, cytosine/purine, uracil, thiamine, allantoin family [Escherichia coli]|uniref:Permease, cytosine/purine, uracil, thiamine, allantoin family n=1 Tax=Escherichia coli TaxID=562 RepID=A0A485JIV0_ECOLX|nr:Permease, cytosine/purine, uracil, thiamine, allantoin family [Escherichia coli]
MEHQRKLFQQRGYSEDLLPKNAKPADLENI